MTKSAYGYGEEWPLTYDDLEPYYCRAFELRVGNGEVRSRKATGRSPLPRLSILPSRVLRAVSPAGGMNLSLRTSGETRPRPADAR
jgi:choline dehydrogenase-like flavoprotein